MAYGPLNLKPREFEELQPCEFEQLLEGYKWRQENTENLMAYFTACQMSVHTKHPVSPMALLKPLRPKQVSENRKSDVEYFKEMNEKLSKKDGE